MRSVHQNLTNSIDANTKNMQLQYKQLNPSATKVVMNEQIIKEEH